MARRAVQESRVGHIMKRSSVGDAVGLAAEIPAASVTFQTDGVDHRAPKQPGIRGTVGDVAGLAAIHANRRMFVDEGTPLIGVALHARLFITHGLIDHAGTGGHIPGRGEGAMGVVAIGTLHGAFIYPMLERHGELSSHRRVAAVAEVPLVLGLEQILGCWRAVNRVAVGADNVIERVLAAANIGAGDRLRVAA